MMLNIFLDTEQALYWLENAQKSNPKIKYTISRKIPVWLEDTVSNRVAIFEVVDFDSETEQRLQIACSHAALVIVLLPEFITDSWIHKFDLPNVVFFINGCLNYSTKHAQVYLDPYFFWSTVDFYRAHPEVLSQLYSNPTHSFDVLLGRQKPHRDIIYNTVDHERNVVRYFPTNQDQDIKQYSKINFEWPSTLIQAQGPVTMTAQAVIVGDTIVSLSQIIPVDIYNRTSYTLVAETQVENEFSFFTEKIVKPMLAKRLFIVCSGQYYLRNLRKLGFRTFDGLIDESYDKIESWKERTWAACREAQRLSTLDGNLVQSAIADVVEHNYHHLMNTPWQTNLFRDVGKILLTV
jgi:hypothetical protein